MIVGASGSILTNLMAAGHEPLDPVDRRRRLRRRSITTGGATEDGVERVVRSTSASDAAVQMAYANRVVIVPGYGMAVAQAQHAVREMTKLLEAKGIEVSFAIHPVAGRMPGHMNVLLAEADVPYDQLKEMDEANSRVRPHRRQPRHRRQRRHQPRCPQQGRQPDLRDADPQRRRVGLASSS